MVVAVTAAVVVVNVAMVTVAITGVVAALVDSAAAVGLVDGGSLPGTAIHAVGIGGERTAYGIEVMTT